MFGRLRLSKTVTGEQSGKNSCVSFGFASQQTLTLRTGERCLKPSPAAIENSVIGRKKQVQAVLKMKTKRLKQVLHGLCFLWFLLTTKKPSGKTAWEHVCDRISFWRRWKMDRGHAGKKDAGNSTVKWCFLSTSKRYRDQSSCSRVATMMPYCRAVFAFSRFSIKLICVFFQRRRLIVFCSDSKSLFPVAVSCAGTSDASEERANASSVVFELIREFGKSSKRPICNLFQEKYFECKPSSSFGVCQRRVYLTVFCPCRCHSRWRCTT